MTKIGPAFSIGQVADLTGLSVHTLRFYERKGLFAGPVVRGPGGRRVYSSHDVEWLGLCSRLRESGMPLNAIRRYAELVRQGPGNENERLELLRAHQDRVTAQISELAACLSTISYKVRVYEKHIEQGIAAQLWTTPLPPGSQS